MFLLFGRNNPEMNKGKFINIVKGNKGLFCLYYFVMSGFVNFLRVFVKTDDHLILFVSYGGRYFNDSPRCIYEAMKSDARFRGYKLVWAFRCPADHPLEDSVKIDTIKFYLTALKARCWVTNSIVERALSFQGKNTYYFHTTHVALPKYGTNDNNDRVVFGRGFKYKYDCSCAQSDEEKKIQQRKYGLRDEQILVCGYPKNDALACTDPRVRIKVLNRLGISEDKTVLLYAPTFRDESLTKYRTPVDFGKWKKTSIGR